MSAAGGNECVGRHARPGPGSSLTLGQARWVCWAMAVVFVSLSQAGPGAGFRSPGCLKPGCPEFLN